MNAVLPEAVGNTDARLSVLMSVDEARTKPQVASVMKGDRSAILMALRARSHKVSYDGTMKWPSIMIHANIAQLKLRGVVTAAVSVDWKGLTRQQLRAEPHEVPNIRKLVDRSFSCV